MVPSFEHEKVVYKLGRATAHDWTKTRSCDVFKGGFEAVSADSTRFRHRFLAVNETRLQWVACKNIKPKRSFFEPGTLRRLFFLLSSNNTRRLYAIQPIGNRVSRKTFLYCATKSWIKTTYQLMQMWSTCYTPSDSLDLHPNMKNWLRERDIIPMPISWRWNNPIIRKESTALDEV